MTAAPLSDGAVLVEGDRVVAVGPGAPLRARADRHHRIDGVLLPGLVDARTRLECADAPRRDGGPYHRWREAVVGPLSGWDDGRVGRSAQRGVHALLRAGTTCAGDVVLRGPAVPAASRAGLRGDSWVEIEGVDVAGQDAVLAALRRTLQLPAPGRRVGLALPGTHAVGVGVLQALTSLAAEAGAPMQTVVAASREEAKAVTEGTGPLAREAGMAGLQFEWLDGGSGVSPLAYADKCGALRGGWSVAHATKFRRGEARVLADRGVASVLCPRALPVIGRPRLAELAAAGTAVALGTEVADGPPDVLAEAAAWVAAAREQGLEGWRCPEGTVGLEEAAVRIATIDGAAAMGWGDVAGRLGPGRRADLVGVGLATEPDRVYEDLVADGAAGRS
jgi:aminodeoxyfutalosine deaminase